MIQVYGLRLTKKENFRESFITTFKANFRDYSSTLVQC
jgi:hypothetical protein